MFTVLIAYVALFVCVCVCVCVCVACFVVRDLCRSGCRQNYYLTPSTPSAPYFFFPTHNSFFNTSDSYLKSARG